MPVLKIKELRKEWNRPHEIRIVPNHHDFGSIWGHCKKKCVDCVISVQRHGYNQPPIGQKYGTHGPIGQTMNLFTLKIYSDWTTNLIGQQVQWQLFLKEKQIYPMVFRSKSFTDPVIPINKSKHFQVKMYKTHQVRTTFGSSDVEKVHAVVARSTFPSQNVQNTPGSDHFWRFGCCFASIHYTTGHYTTLHSSTLHYTTLHSSTLHYIKLHYTTLHYIEWHCNTDRQVDS